MKAKTLILLSAVTFAGLAIAQAPPVYTAVEAGKHVGETATVKDKVDGAYQSARGHIFLSMGPNQAFTAFIPASSAAVLSPAAIRKANPRCLWEDRPV
jgi:hypothetical protein